MYYNGVEQPSALILNILSPTQRDYFDFQTDGHGQILLMFRSNLFCNATRITLFLHWPEENWPPTEPGFSQGFFIQSVPDEFLAPCHCCLGFWLA